MDKVSGFLSSVSLPSTPNVSIPSLGKGTSSSTIVSSTANLIGVGDADEGVFPSLTYKQVSPNSEKSPSNCS